MFEFRLFAPLALLFFLPCALGLPPESGSISGGVSDENMMPVSSAVITARHMLHGTVSHTTSDDKGEFRIASLRSGVYSLRLQARGYCEQWLARVEVETGKETRQNFTVYQLNKDPTCPASAENLKAGSFFNLILFIR